MNNNVARKNNIGADSAPEQLSLMGTASVPLQFRLDERTRRSGLAHVAELRAQLANQAAASRGTSVFTPRERQIAA